VLLTHYKEIKKVQKSLNILANECQHWKTILIMVVEQASADY